MTGMRGLVGCVYELRTGLGPLSLCTALQSPAGRSGAPHSSHIPHYWDGADHKMQEQLLTG